MRRALITTLFAATSTLAAQDAFGSGWSYEVPLGGSGKYGARVSGSESTACEQAAITAGLNWLRDHQHADGRWVSEHSRDRTVALTSLAVLAMSGHGSTMRRGAWSTNIKNAARWLWKNQRANGAFADATGPHLLATLAITECFLLGHFRLLEPKARRAVAYANTLRAGDGGWRASPDDKASDPSLTLWGTTVLVTACDANLIAKDDLCHGVFDWLRSPRAALAPNTSILNGGLLGATIPADRQAEFVYDQAAANSFTLCWVSLKHADAKTVSSIRKNALARARSLPRNWGKNPLHKLSLNEWFCSTYALAQAGDKEAVAAICKALAKAQVPGGENKGSWQPIGVWGEAGGRVWTTAMAVLTLEAPHRYAKIVGM